MMDADLSSGLTAARQMTNIGIEQLRKALAIFALERGWTDHHTPRNLLISLFKEVSVRGTWFSAAAARSQSVLLPLQQLMPTDLAVDGPGHRYHMSLKLTSRLIKHALIVHLNSMTATPVVRQGCNYAAALH